MAGRSVDGDRHAPGQAARDVTRLSHSWLAADRVIAPHCNGAGEPLQS